MTEYTDPMGKRSQYGASIALRNSVLPVRGTLTAMQKEFRAERDEERAIALARKVKAAILEQLQAIPDEWSGEVTVGMQITIKPSAMTVEAARRQEEPQA